METEIIKLGKWNAIIFYDEKEMEYVISNQGIGGAIIAHGDKEIAKKKWINAMQLADAVYKLFYYSSYGKFPN